MENGLPNRHYQILVVEDEPLLLMSFSDMLRDLGHEVVEAIDAPAALVHLEAHPDTDILITDINMPSMNGIELVNRARQLIPSLPVIFSSGYGAEKVSQLGIGVGTYFLQKPFSPEAMENTIRKLSCPVFAR